MNNLYKSYLIKLDSCGTAILLGPFLDEKDRDIKIAELKEMYNIIKVDLSPNNNLHIENV